jgi:hypothetical protein
MCFVYVLIIWIVLHSVYEFSLMSYTYSYKLLKTTLLLGKFTKLRDVFASLAGWWYDDGTQYNYNIKMTQYYVIVRLQWRWKKLLRISSQTTDYLRKCYNLTRLKLYDATAKNDDAMTQNRRQKAPALSCACVRRPCLGLDNRHDG